MNESDDVGISSVFRVREGRSPTVVAVTLKTLMAQVPTVVQDNDGDLVI